MTVFEADQYGALRPAGGEPDVAERRIEDGTWVTLQVGRRRVSVIVLSSYETDSPGMYEYRLKDRAGRSYWAFGYQLIDR